MTWFLPYKGAGKCPYFYEVRHPVTGETDTEHVVSIGRLTKSEQTLLHIVFVLHSSFTNLFDRRHGFTFQPETEKDYIKLRNVFTDTGILRLHLCSGLINFCDKVSQCFIPYQLLKNYLWILLKDS